MPGPAPTPTPILKARGSWRAKTRKGEVRPKVAAPDRPTFLEGEAAAEWDRQIVELVSLGVLARVDRAALAVYCQAWGRYVAAVEQLKDKKVWAKGCSRVMWVLKDAEATLLKIAAQFGFTPAARARLQTQGDTGEADPMEAFFTRSAN